MFGSPSPKWGGGLTNGVRLHSQPPNWHDLQCGKQKFVATRNAKAGARWLLFSFRKSQLRRFPVSGNQATERARARPAGFERTADTIYESSIRVGQRVGLREKEPREHVARSAMFNVAWLVYAISFSWILPKVY